MSSKFPLENKGIGDGTGFPSSDADIAAQPSARSFSASTPVLLVTARQDSTPEMISGVSAEERGAAVAEPENTLAIKHPYKIFTIALPLCTNCQSISLHRLSAMSSAEELASFTMRRQTHDLRR
ncbi:hypothetical protein [Sphingomonas paucimobilis]|jgi:hypothetical protein|uniref:hypothetical protein n=1 Tax=Sphingomonas paucimobilis TaxID=13689 RepID=UPI00203CC4BA|nr:hypothetical protein [Sphingomonas paucimobilis]MCM3681564.1 hypothetical protein [Sphingomonas paucimobilis]